MYDYTKPRGPIAAMYSSPGPCYSLPGLIGQKQHDPRSEHSRAAAYCFGIRHGKFADDCSPGPKYLPDSKLNQHGPKQNLSYSIYSRPKPGAIFNTPGPGSYSPEKSGASASQQMPKYSFGIRVKGRQNDKTPAANSYTLPPMIGNTAQSSKRQAPCYTITSRQKTGSFHEDMAKAPGPGTYNVTEPSVYKTKAPDCSMTSRNVMPGDTTQKPGPGAHSPENVTKNKRQAPQFSFGIRHSQYTAPLIVECAD